MFGAIEKLLIIRRLVLLVEASRKAEIRKFDMATPIKENIIGFNITVPLLAR